jgi:hypothetical protein
VSAERRVASGDNRFDLDFLRNHHFCRSLSRSKLVLEALPDVHSVPVSRFSSKGEVTFLQKLISKHGSDVEAMARDRRLNPEQRTEGELRRAIRRAGGGDSQTNSANSGDRLAASKNSLIFGRRANY